MARRSGGVFIARIEDATERMLTAIGMLHVHVDGSVQ